MPFGGVDSAGTSSSTVSFIWAAMRWASVQTARSKAYRVTLE